MIGKIVKGISGFYYVYVVGSGIYECKAKGAFRKQQMKPLVGDMVELKVLDEANHIGNVEDILPRKNALVRPAVANVDQALVIFAVDAPKPNLNLLDRFLVMMEYQNVPVHICFNKQDLAGEQERDALRQLYESAGYSVHFTQATAGIGCQEILDVLQDKTTTVAGPSGVGKSSLINQLQQEVVMETGDISQKIGRGKHTTRHSELLYVGENTFIMDTPGFSSMYVPEIEKEDLRNCFPEFETYAQECRFLGCVHIHEPDCGVKSALERGEISRSRYDNYLLLYEELANKKKY
jgi:ribosome biogenesis GTPase